MAESEGLPSDRQCSDCKGPAVGETRASEGLAQHTSPKTAPNQLCFQSGGKDRRLGQHEQGQGRDSIGGPGDAGSGDQSQEEGWLRERQFVFML